MTPRFAHRMSITAALAAFICVLPAPTSVRAHYVPAPCDFITGGGFIFKDNGHRANFGAHGGCKHGKFWGHVNYVDHETGFHLSSTEITGYLWDPAFPTARDICGWARTNTEGEVFFRVRLEDNGEPGRNDQFGIATDDFETAGQRFMVVTTRKLANGQGGGGNVQLHKGNRSNTIDAEHAALQEWQMCGDLNTPDGSQP